MILNRLFSSKARIKILRELALSKKPLFLTEVANAIGISKGGVSKSIDDLIKAGIVRTESRGKNLFLSINTKNSAAAALIELFKWEQSVENEIFPAVYEKVLEGTSTRGLLSVLLFGSRARKDARLESDIDLFCIYRARPRKKAETKIINGLIVSIFYISRAGFIKKAKGGDPFISNVILDAKVQKGGSEYREILKEAGI